jgi:hypothetical protein
VKTKKKKSLGYFIFSKNPNELPKVARSAKNAQSGHPVTSNQMLLLFSSLYSNFEFNGNRSTQRKPTTGKAKRRLLYSIPVPLFTVAASIIHILYSLLNRS